MNHILSEEELQDILNDLSRISKEIAEEKEKIDIIINNFESNPVVESFYASGNFGKSNQETLQELKSYITEYESSINGGGGLVETTKSFVQNQLSRVQGGQ